MKILNSSSSNQGNLSTVLKQLRLNGTQSNAQLSRAFNVPAGTTARHLMRLEKLNLIRKTSPVQNGGKQVGKPPVLYEINPDASVIMAVEVNKYKIRIIAADFSAKTLFEQEYKTAPKAEIVPQIKSLIHNQLKRWPSQIPPPLCISLGISSVVSRDNILSGRIFSSPVNLQSVINEGINIPVMVENDANLAVIGEKNFGVCRNASNIVYILDSYDFGIGLLINGSLYKGAHGRAGETTINEFYSQGTQPWKLAGGLRLEDAIKSSCLTQTDFSNHEIIYRLLGQQAEAGDKTAQQILEQLASELAEETLKLLRLFDPENIVIAGNIVEAGQFFKDIFLKKITMARSINNNIIELSQIIFSELGQKSVIMGAVAVGIDSFVHELTE
jgi:N-acetylglucosamine repressor